MRRALLGMCALGVVAPYALLMPWVARNGLDLGLFAEQMLANPISAFLVADIVISAIVVILMAAQGLRMGDMRMVWPIVGTLTVGVSLGLPLYLYLERGSQGVRDASHAAAPASA